MEVKIKKEIHNYTESMFFGLSMCQFIFSVLACGVQELKAALISAEVENPIDMERIKLALESWR